MPHVLVLYASHTGQTARIAQRIADRLQHAGNQVTTQDVQDLDGDPDMQSFDAVLVGGSVNYGRHDRLLVGVVRRNRRALATRPSGLFSVSLAAAHPEMDDTTSRYVQRFARRTGWQPSLVGRFAGAIRYSQYGALKRQVMKRSYGAQGLATDSSRDHEYTDWKRVTHFADSFAALVAGEPAARKRTMVRLAATAGAAATVAAGAYAYERRGRPYLRNWGSSNEEQREAMPGDEILPNPASTSTMAITIDAPPTDVWPWLAQMGARRGGWYNYHLFDHLRRHSATTVMPGFQDLHEGDLVPANQRGRVALPVARLDPERHLVFGHPIDVTTRQRVRRPGVLARDVVWGFHLKAEGERTRLVVRTIMGRGRNALVTSASVRAMEGVHHLMQRRQLQTIRKRAEAGLDRTSDQHRPARGAAATAR